MNSRVLTGRKLRLGNTTKTPSLPALQSSRTVLSLPAARCFQTLNVGCTTMEMPEAYIRHPWNPNSDIYLKRLSQMAGLRRITLSIARVPPGKESFLYHRHERDEEFLFILSGRGRAEIGDEVVDVGAGDLLGFPAPDGPPHHLANPFNEDLVYLMSGESSGRDISYFPRLGRRIVFAPSGIWGAPDISCEQMTMSQWQAE